jgi:dihydrolipoamide dehydrogenase
MNQRNASMTVIGAGSYGTALAITLARNGHEVVLWGHDPEHIATLERDRCNAAFLPDVPFPDTLHLESDLATALAASRNILVVVPSHVFGEVLRQIKPLMRPDARLVWATKGLEAETGRLLQDVAREALGDQIPLAVISGPTFAKELAAGGKKVAIIEDKHWGGTCLNCGCIPTKMLLGATAPLGLLKAQERLRTMKGSIDIDYKALQTRVGRFLKGSSQTLAKSLAAAGITLYEGRGVCAGKGQAIVRSESGEEMLTTVNIILSCGSSSASFPGLAPDGDAVLDSTGVLNLPEVPESLIIVGAGAIGLELGDFFGMMGSKITIVEAAPHIAPTEDADIAKEMDRVQSKAGRTCITGVMAKSLVTKDGQAELTLGDGRVLTASKALVAVGRTPNTAGLDCEKTGCTLKRRGFVDVNDHLEAAEGVYAIGDVNGLTLLAHAADHQGAYVARRILGHEKGVYVPGPVPSCIYGSTEIMRVGQTAKGLLAAGKSVSVSQVPLTLNPIAQAAGASGGFVKVAWTGDAIAGIAAIGHGVSHLVTVAQLLMVGGYTPERLHEVMIGHPTLDEIVPAAIRAPRVAVTE